MKRKRVIVKFLRIMPLLVCVVMLAHVILLNLGFDAIIAEIIEVCLGFTAVWLMSKSLGYCFTHRLQIAYAYIVTVYMGEDLVLSFLFAIVAAYLSAWLGLLLILLQRLYNESWERLRKRSKPKK